MRPTALFSPASNLRGFSFAAALLLAIGISLFPSSAHAQATFSGVQISAIPSAPAGLTGITTDSNGNLYIAVKATGTVYKETFLNGAYTQTVVASGFSSPVSVSVDLAGNVYVADAGPGTIYEESPSGHTYTQSVVASVATPVDIVADLFGTLYIAQGTAGQVTEIDFFEGAYMTPFVVASGFTNASAIAVFGLNLYIADFAGGIIDHSLDRENPHQFTVDGSITSVTSMATDFHNNLFLTTAGSANVIEETNPGNRGYVQSPVAGTFTAPQSLATDAFGNLYVGDSTANAIDEIEYGTLNLGSVAIGSQSQTFTLSFTIAADTTIPAPSQSIVTTGVANYDFLDTARTCTSGNFATATTCTINVAFKPHSPGTSRGALTLFNNFGNATIALYGVGTAPQIAFPNTANTVVASGLAEPYGLAVDAAGNSYVLVSSATNADATAILKISPAGAQTVYWDENTGLEGIALNGAGDIYTSTFDPSNDAAGLVVIPADGDAAFGADFPFNNSQSFVLDAYGNYYVAYGSQSVSVAGGAYKGTISGNLSQIATGFQFPNQMALDNQGNLYVADENLGLFRVTPQGTQSIIAASDTGASGVAVDPAGNVYYADLVGPVFEIPAGGGAPQLIGNTGAAFSLIALDGSGNIYFTDRLVSGQSTGALGRINRSIPPSLSFATTKTGATSTDSPKTSSLLNIGNEPLTASAVSYPVDFPEQTAPPISDCKAGTLPAGEACTFSIDFKPTSGGSGTSVNHSENLTITSNSLNQSGGVQNISLNGTETVAPKPKPSISLVTSNATPAAGSTYTLTATVSGSGATPTGSVAFYSDSVLISTIPLASGKAVLIPSLTVGAHSLIAIYSGDSNYASATSTALAITVTKPVGQVSLTASANPVQLGAAVTFTATVATTIAGATPTGSMQFLAGSTLLATTPLTGGKATFTAIAPSIGTQVITASYSGDSNYGAATSTLSLTVSKATSALTFSASPNPVAIGQSVTLTVSLSSTISGTAPTGSIEFLAGTTVLKTVTIAAGKASFTATAPAVGTQTITASYSGDTHYAAGTTTLAVTVTKAVSTMTFTASPNPATVGKPVILTAQLSATIAGTAPTGTVQFLAGSKVLATATVTAGQATFTATAPSAGTQTVTASYSGDTHYATASASTSITITQ